MKNFVAAEKISDITTDYLKAAIQYCYGPFGIADNFTDKFYTVLESDLKLKHRNLKWLLGDSLRVSVEVSDDLALQTVLKSDKSHIYNAIVSTVKTKGAEITPELLKRNRVIYKGNEYKLTKFMMEHKDSISFDALTKVNFNQLAKLYIKPNKAQEEFGPYVKILGGYLREDDTRFYPTVSRKQIEPSRVVAFTPQGVMCVEGPGNYRRLVFVPKENLEIESRIDIDTRQIEDVIQMFSHSTLFISMEPTDIILAANGNGISSCHQVTGSYHLGSISNLRSDFGLVVYTGQREKRSGRQWLWLCATTNGVATGDPHFKFQRPYGTITVSHTKAAAEFIKTKLYEKFDIPKSSFKQQNQTVSGDHCSIVYKDRVGYLDTHSDSSAPWFATSTRKSRTLNVPYFNHPLPIWFSGEEILRSSIGSNRDQGAISTNQLPIVTDIFGKHKVARDVLEVEDGVYIAIDDLLAHYKKTSGLVKEPEEVQHTVTIEVPSEPTLSIDDVILDEDF